MVEASNYGKIILYTRVNGLTGWLMVRDDSFRQMEMCMKVNGKMTASVDTGLTCMPMDHRM